MLVATTTFLQQQLCHGQGCRVFWGMGKIPPLMTGILIYNGPYKPLRTWVEFPIPYYMEMSWELIDPATCWEVVYYWTSRTSRTPPQHLKTTTFSFQMVLQEIVVQVPVQRSFVVALEARRNKEVQLPQLIMRASIDL